MASELEILLEQIGEMLAEWPADPDDAIELAAVAALAERMGAPAEALAEVEAWRDGEGEALLEEGWAEVEIEELVEAIDAVCDGSASDEEVEEALFDFDEIVAAAIWTNRGHHLREAATRVATTVRDVPEVFAALADFAAQVAALAAVARDLDLYDYWIAVAQSGEWADDGEN